MNKTYKFPALWMMCLMLFSCLTFTACDNGDDEDTNQYKGGISLNVFGPSPVSRGGVLRFLGSGMDKVTAVAIPGCDDITDIEVVSDTEIRVTVPQTAQPGLVVLKTPKGDITTKTELTFTEPIALEAFAPAEVKPGSELTITGEYLNLIKEVIFADEVTVPADEFVSQSRQEIKVIVPDSAQTGKFILSDGAEIPNWIYSEGELEVTLPSVEAPLDLVDKKPGDVIRVSGENFDLVKKVQMPNGDEVEFTMTASSEGDELTFTLPDNVSDGEVTVLPASDVKVVVATVVVATPSNVVAVPAVNLRGGDMITLKGTNMDLVTVYKRQNDSQRAINELKAQRRDVYYSLGTTYKAYYENGSWTVNPDETRYNPDAKAPNVTVSSFTLPFPTEDVVFNPNLMKDPVHVDVRSEFSY